MATLVDVERAAVPFPDTLTIEYPPADKFRAISEKRIPKYGASVDLLAVDEKTQKILNKLDEPISMPFPTETPLAEVIDYIKSATTRGRITTASRSTSIRWACKRRRRPSARPSRSTSRACL